MPVATIESLLYHPPYDNTNPNTLEVNIEDIEDLESGIDQIQYTIMQDAQANLANATWFDLVNLQYRPRRTGTQSVLIPLSQFSAGASSSTISLFIRVTNGAGLQTVINQAIPLPGNDLTPPTPPNVSLDHTGFYASNMPNHLRIIVSGSKDFESGIINSTFRVIDGQTGSVINDWDNFIILNPNHPTYILPATELTLPLPEFESSRSVIVEVKTTNRVGLSSATTTRFLPLELDVTPPSVHSLNTTYYPPYSATNSNSIVLDIGSIEDNESPITSIDYRILDLNTQNTLFDWSPVSDSLLNTHQFGGHIHVFSASILPSDCQCIAQVRATNKAGLSSVVDNQINISEEQLPPEAPSLLLDYALVEDSDLAELNINIGKTNDVASTVAGIRYQIRDLSIADSVILPWQEANVPTRSGLFIGTSITESVPALQSGSQYLVEVEIFNTSGLSTEVSGVIDNDVLTQITSSRLPEPIIELFYFDVSNTIRSSELEVSITPGGQLPISIDSLYYRFDTDADQEDASSGWKKIEGRHLRALETHRFFTPVSLTNSAVDRELTVRLFASNGTMTEATVVAPLIRLRDTTAPVHHELSAIYYGYHHPERPNNLDLLIGSIEDQESRIASVSYRIVEANSDARVLVDWTDISSDTENGIFKPSILPVALPQLSAGTSLHIEVQSINGHGQQTVTTMPVSVVIDDTPPVIDELALHLVSTEDQERKLRLSIPSGAISDQESLVDSVSYQVSIEGDTSFVLQEWQALSIHQGPVVRFPDVHLSVPELTNKQTIAFEIQATNFAGLTNSKRTELEYTLDETRPQLQPIQASYKRTISGGGYLHIEPGSFRDPETNIVGIHYRIIAENDEDVVIRDWTSVPVQPDIRVNVDPIAIPRSLLPFPGAKHIAIEFEAINGAGLSDVRRVSVEIPGDITAPTEPALRLLHRNAYDPGHPNAIEIQIGPSADEESAVKEARYRVVNLTSGESLKAWTSLPATNEGIFPGRVVFEELPFLSGDTQMQVEVEVTNNASLVRSISKDVTIQVERDLTPPLVQMSLYYLSDEIAVVLENLSDSLSNIQKVEYRLLDNVDQSVLDDWTELFDITSPKGSYQTQSYTIAPPDVQPGRAIKVEVRATNGAGLQTTVSKTLLLQQSDAGQ